MNKLLTLKLSALAFLMIFIVSGIHAQDEGPNASSQFGIRAGGNITKQTFDGGNLTEDPNSKFGLDLAVVFKLPLGGGTFMLQPELHWLQKGSVIQDINNEEITSTLNYLELPVLLRYNFGGSAKIFALGGVSAGYLLGGKLDGDNVQDDIKEVYDDLDFSGILGIGIGLGALEVDVRYHAGLTDISQSDGNLGKITNSSYGIGLSLFF